MKIVDLVNNYNSLKAEIETIFNHTMKVKNIDYINNDHYFEVELYSIIYGKIMVIVADAIVEFKQKNNEDIYQKLKVNNLNKQGTQLCKLLKD